MTYEKITFEVTSEMYNELKKRAKLLGEKSISEYFLTLHRIDIQQFDPTIVAAQKNTVHNNEF